MLKAISWWENEISSDKRTEIFDKNIGKGKSWSDIGDSSEEGIAKRHKWLLKMYKKYKNKEVSSVSSKH